MWKRSCLILLVFSTATAPLMMAATAAENEYTPGPVIALHTWLGDKCSFVPDLDVGHCCAIHDIAYQEGGSEADRRRADRKFRRCIRSEGRPIVSRIYYWGVRTFGWLFFNYT